MPKSRSTVPSLRQHKPSGRGVVTLNGCDHYLGPWPVGLKIAPPETQDAYNRVVSEWLANGRRLPESRPAESLSVGRLILAFWKHAEQHYRRPDGTHTNELDEYRLALRVLRELYGTLPVTDFSPLKMKAVRQRMIDMNLCRGVVNQRIGRVVRVFKWGVSEELAPESVHRALATVRGLQRGRSPARETEPVRPVPEGVVTATLPFMLPEVADLARLQLLTGMRPGEAVVMRACDLDTSGEVWLYLPGSDAGAEGRHKTAHHGHRRVIALGPRAQAILRPYLAGCPDGYLFSPRRTVAAKRARMRQARKSKVQPSQVCRKKRKPKRRPGEHWTVRTYYRAVARAVELANRARACDSCKPLDPAERCEQCNANAVPHWHPHQLRHTRATELRREFDLDTARVVLGQRSAQVAEVYAELDLQKAIAAMQQLE